MAMVMRLAPFFPARVLPGDGIEIIRTGGSIIVAMNWDNIQQAILPVDQQNYEFTLRNSDGAFIRVPLQQIILPVVTWSTLAGKPSTFPPSAHTHPISDVTLLQDALDSKVGTSSVIDAAHGGTGQSSYTIGDILYASATGALSKLASSIAGRVLTSNGPGVAPSYQAVPAATTGTVVNTRTSVTATTSGTSKNYTLTGTIKRLRVMLAGVSTSGNSPLLVQLGTGGVATTAGYVEAAALLAPTPAITVLNTTSGALLTGAGGSALAWSGWIEFSLLDAATNTWAWSGVFGVSGAATTAAGHVALAGALNFVNLTTAGGTDTFDAGSFSAEYDTTL